MKKAVIVMAVLIAVVASTTIGGVKTASAFNPQPDPPGFEVPEVQTWWETEIVSMLTAIGDTLARGDGTRVGVVIKEITPDGGFAPGPR